MTENTETKNLYTVGGLEAQIIVDVVLLVTLGPGILRIRLFGWPGVHVTVAGSIRFYWGTKLLLIGFCGWPVGPIYCGLGSRGCLGGVGGVPPPGDIPNSPSPMLSLLPPSFPPAVRNKRTPDHFFSQTSIK